MFSYETREHLASIIGYAEELASEEEGSLDPTQHEHVENIMENATELFDLIADILQ